jgi:hypothetical protein
MFIFKSHCAFFFSRGIVVALDRLQKPLPVSSPGNGATMPKGQVTDPITDQEMLFARLVLAGTMTDRQAAEAAGFDPNTAAYIKSKPRVRAYMLEHRASVQAQLAQQEAEGRRQASTIREQVLARLWEIAKMNSEMTRNSFTSQIKALSMIVAIEGLIPDRRAAHKKSAEPLPEVNIFQAPWLLEAKAKAAAAKAGFDLIPHQEDPAIPAPPHAAAPQVPPAPNPTSVSSESSEYNFAYPSETLSAPVPDPTAAFSTKEPYVKRYGPF